MYWIAIAIYCFFIAGTFILEKVIIRKFNLPKKIKYKNKFHKNQTQIEILIGVIFIISAVMSSITVNESGYYVPLNPIPVYLCFALFLLVFYGFKGYMAKRYAKDSKEHYIHFAYAIWNPIMIIVAYGTTKLFFS